MEIYGKNRCVSCCSLLPNGSNLIKEGQGLLMTNTYGVPQLSEQRSSRLSAQRCQQPVTACATNKMASAKTVKLDARSTPESPTRRRIALDTLRSANDAIVPRLRNNASDTVALGDIAEAQGATLIAKGGYNSVWLVRLRGIFELGSFT